MVGGLGRRDARNLRPIFVGGHGVLVIAGSSSGGCEPCHQPLSL